MNTAATGRGADGSEAPRPPSRAPSPLQAGLRLSVALLASGFAATLWWRPETSTATKALFLGCLGLASTALISLAWSKRAARWGLISAPVVVVLGALIIPASDTTALRASYLAELRRYDGTQYVWGGENARGIDCSGLVRSGLVTASWKNGRLRDALSLWWFDASAKALGEGYRGWTRPITEADSFAALDETQLAPGDLAVTQDGLHVLAYLGERTWIQADPLPMRTHVDTLSAAPPTGWFRVPIRVMRWRSLE